jgi:hypothetical protein
MGVYEDKAANDEEAYAEDTAANDKEASVEGTIYSNMADLPWNPEFSSLMVRSPAPFSSPMRNISTSEAALFQVAVFLLECPGLLLQVLGFYS